MSINLNVIEHINRTSHEHWFEVSVKNQKDYISEYLDSQVYIENPD